MDEAKEGSQGWFDSARGFTGDDGDLEQLREVHASLFDRAFSEEDSGDEGPWEQLREVHSSLRDLQFEIECAGEKHVVVMSQDGTSVTHSDLELEQALNALGGEVPRCLRVQNALSFIRTAEWQRKPDWTLLLKPDSELRGELVRPFGPSFGVLRGVRQGEEATLLRDLSFLPQAARLRVAVSLVLYLLVNSEPVIRRRAAQLCLRTLDEGFQPDRDFEMAASTLRVMMFEERGGVPGPRF